MYLGGQPCTWRGAVAACLRVRVLMVSHLTSLRMAPHVSVSACVCFGDVQCVVLQLSLSVSIIYAPPSQQVATKAMAHEAGAALGYCF